jgi:hypothetical protein
VIYSTHGGCPPVPHVRENHHPECDGLIERGIELAKDPDIGTVVIAADWDGYFLHIDNRDNYAYFYEDGITKGFLRNAIGSDASNKAFLELESMIGQFTKANKVVYLVLPSPTGPIFRPRRMITRSLDDLSFRIVIPNISTASIVAKERPIVMRLEQIAKSTGAIAIDPIASLCGDSTCPVVTPEGQLIFRDGSHLNPEYVKEHVRFLDDVVRLEATHPVILSHAR